MKIASITEAKNQLRALLEKVRNGETVIITDRDRPVARLEPAGCDDQMDPEGHLAHLERRGIIRRGGGRPSKLILQKRPPTANKGESILAALLAERDDAR
jgi:prevent-host-death family protein